jgi:hypothetical protein
MSKNADDADDQVIRAASNPHQLLHRPLAYKNLLTIEVSIPSGALPSTEDSRLVALSPVTANPVRLLPI